MNGCFYLHLTGAGLLHPVQGFLAFRAGGSGRPEACGALLSHVRKQANQNHPSTV